MNNVEFTLIANGSDDLNENRQSVAETHLKILPKPVKSVPSGANA